MNLPTVKQTAYGKRAMNGMAIVVFGLSISLALLAPENVLTSSDALSAMTDLVASISPAIDNLGKISSFPEVTRLVFATMWLMTLPQFVFWAFLFVTAPLSTEGLAKVRERRLVMVLVFFVAVPAILFSFLFLIGNTPLQIEGGRSAERFTRLFSQSRFWLGVAAGGLSLAIAFFSASLVFSARLLPKLFHRVSK